MKRMVIRIKNKVLVEINVPEIDETYNAFLPVNKKISNILILITKAISDMSNNQYKVNNGNALYNRETGEMYSLDVLVRDTNIRNGTRLVLL